MPRGKPFSKGKDGRRGHRPKGAVNRASREIKSWARGMLEDPDYLDALRTRLKKGTAGPVEALLFHYGYGKPKEQVEISQGLAPLIVEVTGLAPSGDE